MDRLICGIDIGSTNIKIVLIDAAYRTLYRDVRPTPRIRDGDAVLCDADHLVDTLEDMILAGWERHGKGYPLTALCSSGVGEDGIYVDRSLHPHTLSIPWFDLRAMMEAEELSVLSGTMSDRTGIEFEPTRTAAKWLWTSRHHPFLPDRSAFWITLTDYPLVRWSGQPFMSETLAARTACYDVYTRIWIDTLLKYSHAPNLPPVVIAGTNVGTFRHPRLMATGAVSSDTRLVAGGHDHPMAASVIFRISPHAIVDSLGTAELLYAESATASSASPSLVRSVPIRGREGQALFRVFDFSDSLAFFRESNDPGKVLADVLEKGTSPRIRKKLVQSGFVVKECLEEMLADGVVEGPIFATGGWSRSDALIRLRATVFNRPVLRVDEQELVALGSALMAGDSVYAEEAKKMPPLTVHTTDPDQSLNERASTATVTTSLRTYEQ